jgi:hypothetical protein
VIAVDSGQPRVVSPQGTAIRADSLGATVVRLTVGNVIRRISFRVGAPFAALANFAGSLRTDTLRSTGRTRTFAAVVRSQFGDTLDPATVVLQSRDTTVVRIVASGYQSVAAGATWLVLRPRAGASVTDSLLAVVAPVPATLQLSALRTTLNVADTTRVTWTYRDSAGVIIPGTGTTPTFVSRTSAVALVSAAGLVTGVTAGTSWIVGSIGTRLDSLQVTIATSCLWCASTALFDANALPAGWQVAGTDNGSGVVNERLERTTPGYVEVGSNGTSPAGTVELDARFTVGGYLTPGGTPNPAQPILQLTTAGVTHLLTVATTGVWGQLGRLEYQARTTGTVAGLGGALGSVTAGPTPVFTLADTAALNVRALIWRDTVSWEVRRRSDGVLIRTLRMLAPGIDPAAVTGVYVAAYSGGPTAWVDSIAVRPRSTKSAWSDDQPLATAVAITSPKTVTLVPGQTSATTWSITQGSAGSSTTRSLRWIARSPAIATVSASGVVTGVAAGTTWIVGDTDFQADSVQVAVGVASSIDAGLIAYYPLNGNGNDLSGNGLNGTLSNTTPVTGIAGTSGSALDFGTSGSLIVPNPALIKGLTQALTIAFWAKRGTSAWNSLGVVPVSRRNGTFIHFNPYWDVQNGTNSIQFSATPSFVTGSVYQQAASASPVFADTDWHHYAYTQVFGSTPGTAIYVDGILQAGSYISGAGIFSANQAALVIDADLYIGRQNSASPGQHNGLMDEVRLYNRALSAGEIAALAERPQQLVAAYPLNGSAADSSGNGRNGTVTGTVAVVDRNGVSGAALRFNGTTDVVTVPADSGLSSSTMTEVTIVAWIRTVQQTQGNIVAKGQDFQFNYNLFVDSGRVNVNAWQSAGATHLRATSSQSVADGQWHQVVGVIREGVSAKIFVDGVLSATSTTPTGTWNKGGAGPLLIGARIGGGVPTVRFAGDIEDVRVMRRALSDAEIQALYSGAPAIICNWCNVTVPFTSSAIPPFWYSARIGNVTGSLLRNNRLEAQQTDEGWEVGALGAVSNTTQEVEFSWSQNLVTSCCSSNRAVYAQLQTGTLLLYAGYNGTLSVPSQRVGSQLATGQANMSGVAGLGAATVLTAFEDAPILATPDSIRVRVLVRANELRWTITDLATGSVIQRRRTPVTGVSPAALRGAFFNAYQTTGSIAWMDSIAVTTRTALSNEPAVIATIHVTGTTTVAVGNGVNLAATPRDSASVALTGRTITWTSRTPSVATVSGSGTVTGAAAGNSWIVASSEGVSDSLLVTVTACAWCNITANLTSGTLPLGWVAGGIRTASNAALLRNDRLEGQQTDQGSEVGGVGTPTAGTQEIELGWTQNLASTCCGMYSTISLPLSTSTLNLNVSTGISGGTPARLVQSVRTGTTNLTGIGGFGSLSGTTSQVGDAPVIPSLGDIRVRVVLRDNDLWWTVQSYPSGGVIVRRRIALSGVSLAEIRGAFFATYSTTGSVSWLDSIVTITRTTTTPQPAIIGSIAINGSTSVAIGATLQLSGTPRDSSASALSGRTIVWSTGNAAIATVSSGGVVSGIGAGTTYIYATSEGRRDSVLVSVVSGQTLTVSGLQSGGSGTVTSTPAGINCTYTNGVPSGACSAAFATGTSVTIQASPSGGSSLHYWGNAPSVSAVSGGYSGSAPFPSALTACFSGGNPLANCTVSMSGSTSVGIAWYDTPATALNETFGDGNFTQSPSWTYYVPDGGTSTWQITGGYYRSVRSGAGGAGRNSYLSLPLNIPVTANTRVGFDVRLVSTSLNSGGAAGTEYPANVAVTVRNADNSLLTITFAYSATGGSPPAATSTAVWVLTAASANTWLTNLAYAIRTYAPTAAAIVRIDVGGMGWDYESHYDNIRIFEGP